MNGVCEQGPQFSMESFSHILQGSLHNSVVIAEGRLNSVADHSFMLLVNWTVCRLD